MFPYADVVPRISPSLRRIRGAAAGLLLVSLFSDTAVGQVVPIGDEFQVNTSTTGYQESPRIAAQPVTPGVIRYGAPMDSATQARRRTTCSGRSWRPNSGVLS